MQCSQDYIVHDYSELANNPGGIRRYLTARDENRPVSKKSDQNLSTPSAMKYTCYWKSTELRYRINYTASPLFSHQAVEGFVLGGELPQAADLVR